MFVDYGKRAYLKVVELEKKYEKLQKDFLSVYSNNLVFDFACLESSTNYNKKVKIEVLNDCLVGFNADIKCDIESEVSYQLTINSKLIKSGSIIGGKENFVLEVPLEKNSADINFTFTSETPFSFSAFTLVVSGNVNYSNGERRISAKECNGVDYVTYFSEDSITFYKYENSVLEKVFTLSNVHGGSIACETTGELYLPIISDVNELQVVVYNETTSSKTTYNLGVNGVTSVCGYEGENGAELIFVLGGRIYKGLFEKEQNFTYSAVNRKGIRVYSEPNIKGAYVIKDTTSAKLVLENQSTCVLEVGDFYHVEKIDGGYTVTYKKDNKLYQKLINDRINSPYVLDFCDEAVKLSDNKILKRVREKLTVERYE